MAMKWPGHIGGMDLYPVRSGGLLKPPKGRKLPMIETPGRFPRRYWDPNFYAQLVVAEFAATGWRDSIELPPPPDWTETRREIDTLIGLAEREREAIIDEIVEQEVDAPSYWTGLLMINAVSHPATYDLLKVAWKVGEFAMVYFKVKFSRARPSQIYPALLPPIDSPGHASYPSGHALEGHLMSLSVAEVHPPARSALIALAQRVGRNREIAGLHYPSDTAAGEEMARQCFPILMGCPSFAAIIEEAKREWV